MNPAKFLALFGKRRLSFRSVARTAAGVTTVVKPTGLAVGDLIIVVNLLASATPTISTSGGSSWNTITHLPTSGDRYAVHWKVADAADVSNAVTVDSNPSISSGLIAASYRHAGSGVVTQKSLLDTGSPSSSTATFTGYTASAAALGCICVFIDEAENFTPTGPAAFVVRQLVSGGGGNCTANFADDAFYASGSVAWTNNSTLGKYGVLLEIT